MPATPTHIDVDESKTLAHIAFGSCNRENRPQPMWPFIIQNQPDLWMWTGDNIYGDTHDMTVMKEKYDLQNQNKNYQKLLATCPIIGTWDDHDYGANDAGKTFPYKAESQQLMLDFLNVPKDDPRRTREGAYASYTFGEVGKQVKIILLDSRYFRDSTVRGENGYIPLPEGTILGEAQWQWLEAELNNSTAQFHLIANGIQIIPEEHRNEKMGKPSPHERERLLNLVGQHTDKTIVLISGDRHLAEISGIERGGKMIYEVTSSGLTHSWDTHKGEPNQHRIGNSVIQKNFGLIDIDWTTKPAVAKLQIRGEDNQLYREQQVTF